MESSDYDYLHKIIIIGNPGVGKSALLCRYVDDTFAPNYKSTIGVDFKTKTLIIDDRKVKLQIWDTAGQERYKNIVAAYYRGAAGAIVVYSIVDEESFGKAKSWLDEVANHASGDVVKILVGSKTDLASERTIAKEVAEEWAKDHDMVYFEASPKTGEGVAEIFEALAKSKCDKQKTHNSPAHHQHSPADHHNSGVVKLASVPITPPGGTNSSTQACSC
eukprot:TRINITY_DN2076_c1_g1_i1.p1 TRINITY_DN2076_c1_g1~~TRINITY_DN2076_c1_g1_i1.p1  ORF type:complete len:219 (-),score=44.43 TRINITY_DN2076_c1_g1_i1:23-679(-)